MSFLFKHWSGGNTKTDGSAPLPLKKRTEVYFKPTIADFVTLQKTSNPSVMAFHCDHNFFKHLLTLREAGWKEILWEIKKSVMKYNII